MAERKTVYKCCITPKRCLEVGYYYQKYTNGAE